MCGTTNAKQFHSTSTADALRKRLLSYADMPMSAALAAQNARGALLACADIPVADRAPLLAEIAAWIEARRVTDSFAVRTLSELQNSARAENPDTHGTPDARLPAPVAVATMPDVLRIDPDVARIAYALGYSAPMLAYFVGRGASAAGCGWIELPALHEALRRIGGVSWHTLRYRWIPKGIEAGMWHIGRDGRLYLHSYASVAAALAVLAIEQGKHELLFAGDESRINAPGQFVQVPRSLLRADGRLHMNRWNAAVYAAWLSRRRDGAQISRHILCRLFGLATTRTDGESVNAGAPVLIGWERLTGIRAQRHYSVYADTGLIPGHAYPTAYGVDGQVVEVPQARVSNSYSTNTDMPAKRNRTTKRARQAVTSLAGISSLLKGAGAVAERAGVTPRVFFIDTAKQIAAKRIAAHIRKHGDTRTAHYERIGTTPTGITWHGQTDGTRSIRDYVTGGQREMNAARPVCRLPLAAEHAHFAALGGRSQYRVREYVRAAYV